MASHQYIIPESPEQSVSVETSFQQLPISQRPTRSQLAAAAFQKVKMTEATVDSYRETSLILSKNGRGFGSKVKQAVGLLLKNQMATLSELIEQESYQGGTMFVGTNNKFWLDKRRDDDSGQLFRDWFFSHTEKGKQTTIHYETTDYGLYKLVDGIEYPLSIAEIERFMSATERYRQTILGNLYPFDKTIDDLANDKQDEYRLAA